MTLSPVDEHVTELWACRTSLGSTVYKERKRRPTTPSELLSYPHAFAGEKVSPVRAFCGTRFLDATGAETDAEPTWDEASGKLGIRWAGGNGTAGAFHDDYW